MRLSRFNAEGVKVVETFLDALRQDGSLAPPFDILEDARLSEVLDASVEVDQSIRFESRFQCAAYLYELLRPVDSKWEQDIGLWAWLTILYFDQVCPVNAKGYRKVGEQARYIPVPGDYRKYYRHLLSGPYFVYRAHHERPERSLVVLAAPLHKPGEVAEQLLAGQERLTNHAVLDTASLLYMEKEKLRRGAGGKGPGSVRRFVDILNQLDLTYDLYSLSKEDLVNLLPDEFDRYLSVVGRTAPRVSQG